MALQRYFRFNGSYKQPRRLEEVVILLNSVSNCEIYFLLFYEIITVWKVRIRSYSGSYFPAFRLNMDQNTSKYRQFLRSVHRQFWKYFQSMILSSLCNYLTRLIQKVRMLAFSASLLNKGLQWISFPNLI